MCNQFWSYPHRFRYNLVQFLIANQVVTLFPSTTKEWDVLGNCKHAHFPFKSREEVDLRILQVHFVWLTPSLNSHSHETRVPSFRCFCTEAHQTVTEVFYLNNPCTHPSCAIRVCTPLAFLTSLMPFINVLSLKCGQFVIDQNEKRYSA